MAGILRRLSSKISQNVLQIPSISSPVLDTEPTQFSVFEFGDLILDIDADSQSLVLSIPSLNASLFEFDFVLKQRGLFSNLRCQGSICVGASHSPSRYRAMKVRALWMFALPTTHCA